jgi:hypothetical protein
MLLLAAGPKPGKVEKRKKKKTVKIPLHQVSGDLLIGWP